MTTLIGLLNQFNQITYRSETTLLINYTNFIYNICLLLKEYNYIHSINTIRVKSNYYIFISIPIKLYYYTYYNKLLSYNILYHLNSINKLLIFSTLSGLNTNSNLSLYNQSNNLLLFSITYK